MIDMPSFDPGLMGALQKDATLIIVADQNNGYLYKRTRELLLVKREPGASFPSMPWIRRESASLSIRRPTISFWTSLGFPPRGSRRQYARNWAAETGDGCLKQRSRK